MTPAIDLSTRYMGLTLPHPLISGASPLAADLDTVRRLEDAGTAAIVMFSLFEEQLSGEGMAAFAHLDHHAETFAEAQTLLPDPELFAFGPEPYLEQLRRIKESVDVPVFASLNGTTDDGWLEFARAMESAGADGLELNVYEVATDPRVTGAEIEDRTVAMVRAVCDSLHIPVAIKLSPFYSSLGHFVGRLEDAGAQGLVLFNRFYQADIDVEALELERSLHLSDSSELLLRLRWLAILSPQVRMSLALTGGVHQTVDAVKAIMSGADAVQMVSALLQKGPAALEEVRLGLQRWLEEHEYDSLDQMRGSMSLASCPDPHAYERANYIRVLQGWRSKES